MKRFLFLAAVLALAASATAATVAAQKPTAATAAPTKLTICHETGSDTNPWRRITVSNRAATANPKSAAGKTLFGHLRHVGDAVIVGTGACPSPSATPEPTGTPPAKITICHKTGSTTNPYRRITISSRGVANPKSRSGVVLRGHTRHAGDILIPGATPCPSGAAAGERLTATLRPVQYASGSGTASFRIRLGQGELCYTLSVTGVTDVTDAHIHRASNAAIVVPLAAPVSGSSTGCATVDKDLLREILTTPGAFYVNVHTVTYPDGQVRGTLTR